MAASPTADPRFIFPHRVPLLATRYRDPRRRMLCGRARLFGDRIELSSWRLAGRQVEVLPLGEVVDIEYAPEAGGGNLQITLSDGAERRLYMDQAHVWRAHFEDWLRYDVLPSAKLRGGPDAALAYSG